MNELFTGQPADARRWKIVLKHDTGQVSYVTKGPDKEHAIKEVLSAERAPKSAVVSATLIRERATR